MGTGIKEIMKHVRMSQEARKEDPQCQGEGS